MFTTHIYNYIFIYIKSEEDIEEKIPIDKKKEIKEIKKRKIRKSVCCVVR